MSNLTTIEETVVPLLQTPREKNRHRHQRWMMVGLFVAVVIILSLPLTLQQVFAFLEDRGSVHSQSRILQWIPGTNSYYEAQIQNQKLPLRIPRS